MASRSSAFQFRGGVDVREVGRRLGVGAVVEGSVRLDGNRLRVTAQLIETRQGYHLWSQEYNRGMDDVFAVQEDIARMVASALGDELLENVNRPLVTRGTESTQSANGPAGRCAGKIRGHLQARQGNGRESTAVGTRGS